MRTLAVGLLVLLAAASSRAQTAGHGTLPTTGPGAPEKHTIAPREEDPFLDRLEQVRRDLAAVGKRYKKAKGPQREALAREAAPLVAEIEQRVESLKAAGTK